RIEHPVDAGTMRETAQQRRRIERPAVLLEHGLRGRLELPGRCVAVGFPRFLGHWPIFSHPVWTTAWECHSVRLRVGSAFAQEVQPGRASVVHMANDGFAEAARADELRAGNQVLHSLRDGSG